MKQMEYEIGTKIVLNKNYCKWINCVTVHKSFVEKMSLN